MISLYHLPAFPDISVNIREFDGQYFVFDPIRKKNIKLTPEEWVRQHLIAQIIQMGYNPGLLRTEQGLKASGGNRRSDLMAYRPTGSPYLLAECKAPNINITSKTMDQAAEYNFEIRSEYLLITNGFALFCWKTDFNTMNLTPLDHIPPPPTMS